jgi:hypothetical protein
MESALERVTRVTDDMRGLADREAGNLHVNNYGGVHRAEFR